MRKCFEIYIFTHSATHKENTYSHKHALTYTFPLYMYLSSSVYTCMDIY